MPRTAFSFSAYNAGMEMLLVVLLLALSDKDPAVKEKLRAVLDFYRENRELLHALAGNPSAAERGEQKEPEEEKKSSPTVSAESLRILDEFLKRV